MLSAEKIRSTEKISLTTIRTFIDLMYDESPDFVIGAYGIKIVERAEDRPSEEDCFEYVFGNENPKLILTRLITQSTGTNLIIPGYVALYVNKENNICHVGITTDDGNIISKWEKEGHVYKHPPHHTLSVYGNIDKCYRYTRRGS